MIFLLMIHLWRWRKDAMFDLEALDENDAVDGEDDARRPPVSDGMSDRDDTATTGTEVPVELSAAPESIEGKRVLGVVPGKPVAGERKMVEREDDMVMVWPHLLVRHAVAAMCALLTVMIIAVLFDAPLRLGRQPAGDAEPGEGAVVLRRAPGAAGDLPPAGGRRARAGHDRDRADRPALHRPQSLHPTPASQGGRDHVHDRSS